MNDKTFNIISNGIFTSPVIYGISVFGNVWLNNEDKNRRFRSFSKEDCRRLQVLQNQILRLKLKAPKYTPCKEMITQSGDLSIHQLVAYHTLLQVHKSVLSKKPEYLSNHLSLNLPGNGRTFPHRQIHTITVNRNLSISRSAFMYRGARLWNQLPLDLRMCQSTPNFKSLVKKWVADQITVRPF